MKEDHSAPDGGLWGWLAVFGCFMGNVIGDGAMYSFGIFLPVFKENFDCGAAEISTVNSIQMGVTFAAGKSSTEWRAETRVWQALWPATSPTDWAGG